MMEVPPAGFAGVERLSPIMSNPSTNSAKGRRAAIIYLVVIVTIGLSYLLFGLSRGGDITIQPSAKPRPPLAASRIELFVTPSSIDAQLGQGTVQVVPRLFGAIGSPYGNTSRALVPIRLTIDGAEPPTQQIPAGDVLGVSQTTVLLENAGSLKAFPFDSYTSYLTASAERTDGATPRTIPVVIYPSEPGVPGFDITFTGAPPGQPAGRAQGSQVVMHVTRDDDVEAVTILVAGMMVLSALVVLGMSWLVMLGRRPNTTSGTLVLFAVFPFALILLRQVVPNAPPVGVDYDVYVYYWTVIAAFLSFVGCAVKWLTTPGSE
jgi:hypothetical protein